MPQLIRKDETDVRVFEGMLTQGRGKSAGPQYRAQPPGVFFPPVQLQLTKDDSTEDDTPIVAKMRIAGKQPSEWPRVGVSISGMVNTPSTWDTKALEADGDGWTVWGFYTGYGSVRTTEPDPEAEPPIEAVDEMLPVYYVPGCQLPYTPQQTHFTNDPYANPAVYILIPVGEVGGSSGPLTAVCIGVDRKIYPAPVDYELPEPVTLELKLSDDSTKTMVFQCGIYIGSGE
jgi:hypothetical protein